MRLILHIWRQRNAAAQGRMARYEAPNVSPDMSFCLLYTSPSPRDS